MTTNECLHLQNNPLMSTSDVVEFQYQIRRFLKKSYPEQMKANVLYDDFNKTPERREMLTDVLSLCHPSAIAVLEQDPRFQQVSRESDIAGFWKIVREARDANLPEMRLKQHRQDLITLRTTKNRMRALLREDSYEILASYLDKFARSPNVIWLYYAVIAYAIAISWLR